MTGPKTAPAPGANTEGEARADLADHSKFTLSRNVSAQSCLMACSNPQGSCSYRCPQIGGAL